MLTVSLKTVVQLLNCVRLSVTPWTAARQAFLSFTISWSLLKLMSVESVMPSNCLILCHPLLLSSIFPNMGVFASELAFRIRWPKYWSFSFSISPSNEYSGLIWIDWFDLLAVHGTLESLLQNHSSMNRLYKIFAQTLFTSQNDQRPFHGKVAFKTVSLWFVL